jgi:hypothetical protein
VNGDAKERKEALARSQDLELVQGGIDVDVGPADVRVLHAGETLTASESVPLFECLIRTSP